MLASPTTIVEVLIGGALIFTILFLHVAEEDRRKQTEYHERKNGPPKCPCGYDLRATPDRCPECGREIFGDE